MRRSDLVSGLFRVGLAAVFGYAGYQKVINPLPTDQFIASLFRVELRGVGFTIGVSEILLAALLFLVIAPRAAARAAVIASGTFLTIHAYTMTLPESPPPCGCLGATIQTAEANPLLWLWISSGMLIASVILFWRAPTKPSHTQSLPETQAEIAPA